MSSLLQFDRLVGRRGVRLEFTLEPHRADFVDREPVPCPRCGRTHAQIHVAWRKPAGMWGHWVVLRYNGEEHVPDLSIPIHVTKLPRDARPLSAEENSASWHRS